LWAVLRRYGFFNNKRIVLFDTLIKECSEEQVVAVLAHGEPSSCSRSPQQQQSLQAQQPQQLQSLQQQLQKFSPAVGSGFKQCLCCLESSQEQCISTTTTTTPCTAGGTEVVPGTCHHVQ
jgi:hypothetical protein